MSKAVSSKCLGPGLLPAHGYVPGPWWFRGSPPTTHSTQAMLHITCFPTAHRPRFLLPQEGCCSILATSLPLPPTPGHSDNLCSGNPIPGHISRENHNLKRYVHPNVYCCTIYSSQDMKATFIIHWWRMDKEDVVHIHNGILLSYKEWMQ